MIDVFLIAVSAFLLMLIVAIPFYLSGYLQTTNAYALACQAYIAACEKCGISAGRL